MSKKDPSYPALPPTKAGSAEERLEELVKNGSVKWYRVIHNETWAEFDVKEGRCRCYSDGFEAVVNHDEGRLHIDRRKVFITYDIKKEYEKQDIQRGE